MRERETVKWECNVESSAAVVLVSGFMKQEVVDKAHCAVWGWRACRVGCGQCLARCHLLRAHPTASNRPGHIAHPRAGHMELRRWIGACVRNAASTCLRGGWGVKESSGRACPIPSLTPHAANPASTSRDRSPATTASPPRLRRLRAAKPVFGGGLWCVCRSWTSAQRELRTPQQPPTSTATAELISTPCIHSRTIDCCWSKVGDVRQVSSVKRGRRG
jgi:hypothetical protein